MGSIIGLIKGDTRSLDYGSHGIVKIHVTALKGFGGSLLGLLFRLYMFGILVHARSPFMIMCAINQMFQAFIGVPEEGKVSPRP